MRALVRNDEVMLEKDWSAWVKNNLAFLTGTEKDSEGNALPGDGWTLVEDYKETSEDECSEERILVDGVYMTKAEAAEYIKNKS